MTEVKKRRVKGQTRLSSKNQATIPVAACREAGLHPGDQLKVEAKGKGKVLLTRVDDIEARLALIDRFAGCISDPEFTSDWLMRIREEDDRDLRWE